MRFEGRTPTEAIHAARARGQLVLSCVSDGVLLADRQAARTGRYPLTLGGRLEAAVGGGLSLGVYEDYDVGGGQREFTAVRVAYRYRVLSNLRELLSYHWNPGGPGQKHFPHLHLSAAAEVGNRVLTRAHIPTGAVTLADVVRLLIEKLGVRARRADWRAVLGETVG